MEIFQTSTSQQRFSNPIDLTASDSIFPSHQRATDLSIHLAEGQSNRNNGNTPPPTASPPNPPSGLEKMSLRRLWNNSRALVRLRSMLALALSMAAKASSKTSTIRSCSSRGGIGTLIVPRFFLEIRLRVAPVARDSTSLK